MRLLLVVNTYAPVLGGAEEHARRLAEALAARGHSVRVLTGNAPSVLEYEGSGPALPVTPAHEVLDGVSVERVPYGGFALRWLPVLRWAPILGRGELRQWIRARVGPGFAHRLARAIRRAAPDAVLALGHPHRPLLAAAEAHAARPFPLVVVPRLKDGDPSSDRHGEARLLGEADVVACGTSHEAGLVERATGLPRERIVVTGLGVVAPSTVPGGPRPPEVLFLGCKTMTKGLPLLLRAFREAARSVPEARLVVAGSRWGDSPRVEAALELLPPDVRARVESPYDLDEAEKARRLGAAACLVLPWRFASFGLVLLEAWAHGTPVIACDLPVFRATVTDGVNGLLVPPDDAPALARAMVRLLSDPALARRLGEAGRAQALSEHGWDAVAQRYEEALRRAQQHHAARA